MAIKDMVKELTGKTLDRYNRKIGLGEIGVNDPTQDKILNGIYSQVDYGYLSKTEQSSVLHLDGSGDGVVEIESIEGNSMVNIFKNVTGTISLDNVVSSYTNNTLSYKAQSGFEGNIYPAFLGNFIPTYDLVHNKDYVFVFDCNIEGADFGLQGVKSDSQWVSGTTFKALTKKGRNAIKFTTPNDLSEVVSFKFRLYNSTTNNEHLFSHFKLFEGNNIVEPYSYFEGMQSSFEEKKVTVNGEDKYEIEILSNNENLLKLKKENYDTTRINWTEENSVIKLSGNGNSYPHIRNYTPIRLKPNTDYTFFIDGYGTGEYRTINLATTKHQDDRQLGGVTMPTSRGVRTVNFKTDNMGLVYIHIYLATIQETIPTTYIYSCGVVQGTKNITEISEQKLNKIKLLVNEPLRGISSVKDRLCIKDNKLVVERNFGEFVFNGSENWKFLTSYDNGTKLPFELQVFDNNSNYISNGKHMLCDKFNRIVNWLNPTEEGFIVQYRFANICIEPNKLVSSDLEGFKKWLQANPTKVIYQLAEPFYEEVLNEYGEPILLEGYENGTLYIDSVIVPTTSVRYTQKNESLATIGSINQNNTKTFSDISEDLIPYMMELDFMLMEAEMKSEGLFKMRRVEDLTSMQKRTGDMLARLIKGETLTKEEAFERVVVYLEAGRITQEQATELNLLIQETYRG